MSDEPEGTSSKEGPLSVVGDAIGDLVTGIPAPVRKNAIKAFNRLFTLGVEYPVALIEGKIEEKRAETRARVKLIETSSNQIAAQIQATPEYARAAFTKFGQKILRERVNIDQIVQIAAEELKSEAGSNEPEQADAPSISDNWLNVFESEVSPISTEQMKRWFGKILAGEIRCPQSYSIKTIKAVAQLDNQAAALFGTLCALSVSIQGSSQYKLLDARVVSLGHAGSNSLAAYGLGFGALNILHEYELIIADYHSYVDYRMAIVNEAINPAPLRYQNAKWVLVPKSPRQTSEEFRIHGVALSHTGKELLPIVDIAPNKPYTAALQSFFDQQGMTLTRVEPVEAMNEL